MEKAKGKKINYANSKIKCTEHEEMSEKSFWRNASQTSNKTDKKK